MKKSYFVILFMFIFYSCDNKMAEYYFKKAQEEESSNNYLDAIKYHDEAINKNSDFLPSYINRGVDKSLLGNYQDAINDFEEVIKREPKNILALYHLANNKGWLEQWEEAISIYEKAIEYKGGELIQFDYVDNSLFSLEQAKFDVKSAELFYHRSVAYYEIDSLEKAMYGFEYCIDNNHLIMESLFYMGNIFFEYNQTKEGCECFEKGAILGDEDSKFNFENLCIKKQ